MSTKIYNVEFPRDWLNDSRTVEQLLVRLVLVYLTAKETGCHVMPYALIPDGYSLKKVTKLQKQAVSEKRRHDDVVALLENSQTPLVAAGIVTAFLAGRAADNILDDLANAGETVSEKTKEVIKDSVAKLEKELITDPKKLGLKRNCLILEI